MRCESLPPSPGSMLPVTAPPNAVSHLFGWGRHYVRYGAVWKTFWRRTQYFERVLPGTTGIHVLNVVIVSYVQKFEHTQ